MTLGAVIDLVSGALFLAIAAFVGRVRPKTGAVVAFVVYAAAHGAYFAFWGFAQLIAPGSPDGVLANAILAAIVWLIPPSLVALAAHVPVSLTAADRWPAAAAFALAVAIVAVGMPSAIANEPTAIHAAQTAGTVAASASLNALALLLALRFGRAPAGEERVRPVAALVAGAILLQQGMWAGAGMMAGGPFREVLAANVLSGIVWLANTRGPSAAAARFVAWIAFGSVLAGMLVHLAFGRGVFAYSVASLAAAGALAYAIVRHRMLGIDVKLRWAISKSTLAAIFVAVFFVASEMAQEVFGTALGGAYVGIIAAGGLVFVLAPLQRAAERLAERAVPVAASVPVVPAAASASAIYRQQVELAWADGRISPNERVMLRGLRKNLNIEADAADAIEHEVETARIRGGLP